MFLAATACAAAGLSYILNDDEQSTHTKCETVTISSTIIDRQGIVKSLIYPQIFNKEKGIGTYITKHQSNQLKLPIESSKQRNDSISIQKLSVVFSWSMPLKARLLQTCTTSCLVIENLNPFKRCLMKISIGTQNGMNENMGISSEIVLSNYDEYSYRMNNEQSVDSLSYYPMTNDLIGIHRKKKACLYEREIDPKRFCGDQISECNEKNHRMKNVILKNVNLCVENLSKILSESCSNDEEQLTTLHDLSSIHSRMNNNNNNQSNVSISENMHRNRYSNSSYQHEEVHNTTNSRIINEGSLSDGVVIQRGEQFGIALGDPMIRKYSLDKNLFQNSHPSINELNRLLPKENCLLMRKYKIESIEDLIRLFFEQGQHEFTELMINLFKMNPFIVEQLNVMLLKWTRQWT